MTELDQHGAIRRISAAATHRICSGQVIVDVATAVKELVENALDANATTVEVRLQDYGIKLLEVADNGHGISAQDYERLAHKYTTSKIHEFNDLLSLSTYGFRGEALSSLCAMADLTVVTRTADQQVGCSLEYDHEGCLVKKTLMARAPGTTIALRNLFAGMPVRSKDLQRNVRREFGKLVAVLQAYALICTHVRFSVSNQVTGGSRSLVLSTQGPRPIAATPHPGSGQGALPVPDLKVLHTNIITILGSKVADTLEPIELQLTDLGGNIQGYVSKGTITKSSSEAVRQFLYVNSRPVDFPRIIKMMNETYRSLTSTINQSSKPTAVLNISLPPDAYDINVTPDKRKVLMQCEDQLVGSLKEALEQLWEPSRYTYSVNNNNSTRGGAGGSHQQQVAGRIFTQRSLSHFTQTLTQKPPSQHIDDGTEQVEACIQLDTQQQQPAADTQQDVADTPPELGLQGHLPLGQHQGTGISIPVGVNPAVDSPFKQRALRQATAETVPMPCSQFSPGAAEAHSLQMEPADSQHGVQAVEKPNQVINDSQSADNLADQVGTGNPGLGDPNDAVACSTGRNALKTITAPAIHSATGLQSNSLFNLPVVQPKAVVATSLSAGMGNQQQIDTIADSIAMHLDEEHATQVYEGQEPHIQHGRKERVASPSSTSKHDMDIWNEAHDVQPGGQSVGDIQSTGAQAMAGEGESIEREQEDEDEDEPPSARAAAAFKIHSFLPAKVTASHPQGIAGDIAPRPRHPFLALAEKASAGTDCDTPMTDPVVSLTGSDAAAGGSDKQRMAHEQGPCIDSVATPGVCRDKQRAVETDANSTPTVTARPRKPPKTHTAASPVVVQLHMSRVRLATQNRIARLQAMAAAVDAPPTQDGSQQVDETGASAVSPISQTEAASIQYDNREVSSPVRAAKRRRYFANASLQSDSSGSLATQPTDTDAAPGGEGPTHSAPPAYTTSSNNRADREAAAERELERVFDKAEFREMQVIGQFNLGFILAKLERDIFIIDQHAADEKRTFEKLQATVVLNRQPLLVPRPMNLPYLDELIVRDHWDTVFKRNGFDFKEDPGTGSLMLAAVPYCKGVTFGMDDVRELISNIREGGTKLESIQPSRIRSILASRACRSSIMIGKALDHRQMTKLVHSLADLQAPWNCPHGRPTMRHACVLP